MRNPLKLLYPDRCIACGELVDGEAGLCGPCWADTPFIAGHACAACGAPLLGEGDGTLDRCDDCMADPPPWSRGVAVMAYSGTARRIVLNLKHGDRLDLVTPAAAWMAGRVRGVAPAGTLVVPVPLHWTRLVRRRFNQAALLGARLARELGLETCPDALVRTRRTAAQEDMTREARTANLAGAIGPHPSRGERLSGRRVLIVDDVMTSGATLRSAARAAAAGGASQVSVAVLARVVKDG